MDDYELAKALFKQPKDTKSARIVSGTAYGDSSDGTVQVDLDGSVVSLQTNVPVKEGDTVQVTLSDRSPVVTGVVGWGDKVQAIAEEADSIATATNQHFWSDTNGIHVSTDDQNPAGTRNILINSLGILLRKAANTLVSISESAVAFFDGSGDQTASFGTSSSIIGKAKDNERRVEISSSGLKMIERFGGLDTQFAELGYGAALDQYGQPVNGPYFTFGERKSLTPVGAWSVVSNQGSASGMCACAEGNSDADGFMSHAEGNSTTASGDGAHAEGYSTMASGDGAHAEGNHSVASGENSHAQNNETLASSANQTAIGKFNIDDNADTYALIVGNGTADTARSNALTVAWNGDLTAAGDVADGNGDTIASVKAALPTFEEITGTNIGTAHSSGGVSHTLAKSITDYDLLIVSMQFGSDSSLTNARITEVIPVSQVQQWSSDTDVQNGVKCREFIYCYPASNPSWYINVSVGFTSATTLRAYRRASSNLAYWTISKVYGIKF